MSVDELIDALKALSECGLGGAIVVDDCDCTVTAVHKLGLGDQVQIEAPWEGRPWPLK